MRKYAILMAALLLTGCFHEFHEKMDESGTVAVALQWEQAEDAATPIQHITYSIGNFTKFFASVEEYAGELLQLPAGEYDILVTANMTEADGYFLSGLGCATKSDGSLPEVKVSLLNPASSPAQAWFGVGHASVKEGDITVVEPLLQRLLSTLTVNIANIPAGTKMTLTLGNVAKEVILTAKDNTGRYGVPGSETVADITIPGSAVNLMPTASGQERCILSIELTSAAGIPLTVVCNAPRMETGKSYTLDLDYTKLQPYMYINSSSISPWEDGWTVDGEILNPQE